MDAKILAKGLIIIEELARAAEGLTAADLAKKVELHKSTTYRYLHTLLQREYIKKDGNGRFCLGTKILELSSQFLRRMPLREVAHPFLVRLSNETDKTVHLCVLDKWDVIYLDKVESHRTLPIMSRIGSRAPAYCTGVGKMLLSHLPREQLEHCLNQYPLISRTSETITDRKKFIEELKLTEERGYAIDNGEHEEGIKCFAAPIRGYGGHIVAAISLTGLKRELTGPAESEKMIAAGVKIAAEISRALGHVGVKS